MAKTKSRKSSKTYHNTHSYGYRPGQAWRDTVIARPSLPRRYLSPLSVIEDFRAYHPRPRLRTYRSVFAGSIFSRSVVGMFSRDRAIRRNRINRRRLAHLSMDVHRVLPRSAVICAKRRSRREVIFAMNKAGRGGQRRPRRNETSEIICR